MGNAGQPPLRRGARCLLHARFSHFFAQGWQDADEHDVELRVWRGVPRWPRNEFIRGEARAAIIQALVDRAAMVEYRVDGYRVRVSVRVDSPFSDRLLSVLKTWLAVRAVAEGLDYG